MTAPRSACVVFDLDDTLIDTRRVLLPAALRRVAGVLGVDAARLDATGKRLDEVVSPLGRLPPEMREAAAAAWYDPDVPPLDPVPGARELLEALRGRIGLVLLTRGDPARQARKIERCGLGPFFDEILIRPIEEPGTKREDLTGLLAGWGIAPGRCAVVGDDPKDELRHAADLGCVALRVPDVPLERIPERLREAGLLD